jgi:hypothetical protein
MMKMKQTTTLIAAVITIGVVILGGWYCYLSNVYVWDRDVANQKRIGEAYVRFYLDTKKFPSSLTELVQTGYLPQKAFFYLEPPGGFSRSVDVQNSCYVVGPPPSGDFENLTMIGRRETEGGNSNVIYEPTMNAMVRDEIIKRQIPRNTNLYNAYIAPLEGLQKKGPQY